MGEQLYLEPLKSVPGSSILHYSSLNIKLKPFWINITFSLAYSDFMASDILDFGKIKEKKEKMMRPKITDNVAFLQAFLTLLNKEFFQYI